MMLSDELIQLAATRIQIELAERQERFGQEIQQLVSEMILQGLGRSGAMLERIGQAIAREFDIRAMLAWQVLSRVMSGQSLSFDAMLNRQVKQQIETHLDAECQDLATQYQWTINLIPIAGGLPPFNDIRAKAVAKIESEVDISLRAVGRQQGSVNALTTVNIYQPYGIVQMGSGSVANFTQQFDHTARQQLASALDAMERSIEKAHELSDAGRSQIQEVVREIHAEVSQLSPNVPRLRGLLIGVATTIQTLGSAASAYALLKAAAALIGVYLP